MRVAELLSKLRKRILSYNRFLPEENEYDEDDELENPEQLLEEQLLSTRLYILLLYSLLTLIVLFLLFNPQALVKTINNPSIVTYNKLFKEHSETLTCPCSTITIPYEPFVDLNYSMHPLCHFINNDWIWAFYFRDNSNFRPIDFRNTATAQFQIIRYLCSMAYDIIENEILISLKQMYLISSNVLTENEMYTSIHTTAERIRLDAPILLLRTLSLIHVTTKSDRLISSLRTNYVLPTRSHSFHTFPVEYDDDEDRLICTCTMEICSLITDTGFLDTIDNTRLSEILSFKPSLLDENQRVSGFYGSCTPLDAVLMANFSCLYDETCLNLLLQHFPQLTQEMLFEASSMISVIQEQKTLLQLIDQLFITDWSISTNHSRYFEECSPQSCSFTYNENTNILYAFTKLLSLYGGLTIALRFLTSKMVVFIMRTDRHRVSDRSERGFIRFVRNVIQKLKFVLIKLNLFKTADRDEIIVNQQRWTTRIYLITLFSCLIISLIIFASRTQLVNISVESPSFERYNLLLLSTTTNELSCSCSQISSKYGQFVSYSPRFHQICNSSFNKDFWFDWLYRNIPPRTYSLPDWRYISSNSFVILLKLCELSNSTVYDAIDRFEEHIFVSSRLLDEQNFLENFQSIINDFIDSTETNFGQTINLIRMLHHVNQPIPVHRVNEIISRDDYDEAYFLFDLPYEVDEHTDCYCTFDSRCQRALGIWEINLGGDTMVLTPDFIVPGFVQGCYSTESLLLSNLQCLYSNNSKCLSDTISFAARRYSIPDDMTVEPLDSSLPTRFSQTDLISTIVYKLMVEEWLSNVSYRNYFDVCAVQYCNYRQIQSARFIDIITTLISLYGGFSIILRLILPPIIKRFFKSPILVEANQSTEMHIPIFIRIKNIILNTIKFVRLSLMDLNIFPLRSFNNISRNHAKRLGCLSTRLFIILFTVSFIVLTFYTFIQDQMITKTIENPSMMNYERFLFDSSRSHSTVTCPCSTTSIIYKNFLNIQPIFHQICSSDFILAEWQMIFIGRIQIQSYRLEDYRRFIVGHFSLLSNLCQISIENVHKSISSLLSSYFISSQLLTKDLFDSRVNSIINQSFSSISATLNRQLMIIRSMTHGNQISSFYQTNWKYLKSCSIEYYYSPPQRINNHTCSMAIYSPSPMIYDNSCSCDLQMNCTSTTLFKGLRIGCLPSESFFASTLECFYNQQCLQLLQNLLADTTNTNMTIKPLDSSLTSRYSWNETIVDDLFKELFIETWETSVNYIDYFNQCLPARCTYTYLEQANLFYSITALIALSSGLIVVLKWWCPFIIKIYDKILRRYRNNSIAPRNLLESSN